MIKMKCIRDDVIEILAQYEHDRWSSIEIAVSLHLYKLVQER